MRIRIATSFKHSRFLAALLAAAMLIGSKASALPLPTREVTVKIHDLDLTSPAGARTLLRRLDRAVSIACEEQLARRFPSARRAYRACYADVMADTIARLDVQQVREQYRLRHTG